MSQFVNYNKRSVKLPPGCKELSDLFKPKTQQPLAVRVETAVGTLTDIEKHVAMVFNSQAQGFALMIGVPSEQLTVYLCLGKGEGILASVVFRRGAEREQAMRAFFGRHGLQAPEHHGAPGPFDTDLAFNLVYPISPLPPGPLPLSRVTTELFRELSGLDDESKLQFHYWELTNATNAA